jgi:hypothetical protein
MGTIEDFKQNLIHAQPRWAQIYELVVGLPAWVYLAVRFFKGDDLLAFPLSVKIAVGLFVSAVLLQMAMFFRAFWRMDA